MLRVTRPVSALLLIQMSLEVGRQREETKENLCHIDHNEKSKVYHQLISLHLN